jgi:hypothetical protein
VISRQDKPIGESPETRADVDEVPSGARWAWTGRVTNQIHLEIRNPNDGEAKPLTALPVPLATGTT